MGTTRFGIRNKVQPPEYFRPGQFYFVLLQFKLGKVRVQEYPAGLKLVVHRVKPSAGTRKRRKHLGENT